MIEILGVRRIVVLAVLLSLNLIFFVLSYMVAAPQLEQGQRDLRNVRKEYNKVQRDFTSSQLQLSQLDELQERYNDLQSKSFFGKQSRVGLKAIFEAVEEESGIVEAAVSLGRRVVVNDKKAQDIEHKIIRSDITLNIKAAEDVNIFSLLGAFTRIFQGQLQVKSFTLNKKQNITVPLLQEIMAGNQEILAEAVIKAHWLTIVSEDQAADITPSEGGRR